MYMYIDRVTPILHVCGLMLVCLQLPPEKPLSAMAPATLYSNGRFQYMYM